MARKISILVVDDEESVRDSLSNWFIEDGYHVECAENARKALTMLEDRGISHEKTTSKIIFFPKSGAPSPSMQDMMAEAQKVVGAMSPEEMQKLMTLYQNMTPGQQADIVKKAKDMGLG